MKLFCKKMFIGLLLFFILLGLSILPVWLNKSIALKPGDNDGYLAAAHNIINSGGKLPQNGKDLYRLPGVEIICYNPDNFGNPDKVFICTMRRNSHLITCGDGYNLVVPEGQLNLVFDQFEVKAIAKDRSYKNNSKSSSEVPANAE